METKQILIIIGVAVAALAALVVVIVPMSFYGVEYNEVSHINHSAFKFRDITLNTP